MAVVAFVSVATSALYNEMKQMSKKSTDSFVHVFDPSGYSTLFLPEYVTGVGEGP
jgi:hypothetical protein